VDDVVIVGAGPAGLAAAATLRSHGIGATIIERGRVGEPWRTRYDRLHLHTIRSLSHLPGYRIPRDFGRWVARDQFVQYLEQYAAHHCLEPRFGVEVTRIDRDNGHWSLHTTAGTLASRTVVVATGYTRLPQLPRWPGTFDGSMVHSVEYHNPRPYRDQDVLVVGAGNSGTEIAVDLAEGGAARVRIAIRTPPNILRRDVKGVPTQLLGIAFRRLPPRVLDVLIAGLRRTTVPDLSAYGLPRRSAPFSQFQRTGTVPIFDVGFIDAVRSGAIEVVPGVNALDGSGVVLADGSRVFPDAVIAATGYRPGLEPLVGHLTAIGEHGIPSSQFGLHFIGMRLPVSGFLHEVSMDARQLARDVARELGALRPVHRFTLGVRGASAESRVRRSPSAADPAGPRDCTADAD
jgi:putative flavoprotein involved in K+ transport